jgi:pyrimidine-nucleoside phosphorylase
MTDVIDPKAGIWIKKNVGNYVEEGETLAVIYTDREKVLSAIRSKIQNAYNISVTLPEKSPLILAVVDKIGVHKDIQKYIS